MGEFFLSSPEGNRQGIFKILIPENKESLPPAFIPADVMSFSRWRFDLQKGWTTFEKTLTEVSPAFAGALKLVFDSAGRETDTKFDLRRELIGNLGDDLIVFQKAPAPSAGTNPPASIFLLGAKNPGKLALAIKAGLNSLAPRPSEIQERELAGRITYTMTGASLLSFSTNADYVVFSKDSAALTEFFREVENKKSLIDSPGLREAAQKVGGATNGYFSYENPKTQMKGRLALWKSEPATLSSLVGIPALVALSTAANDPKQVKEWFDSSLLPSYDAIAKYFYFSVSAANFGPDGISIKLFNPTPPELK